MTRLPWLPRSPGIRQQLTLLTALVVAVPLLVGVLVMANLLQRSLTASLVDDARGQARSVAQQVHAEGPTSLADDRTDLASGIPVQLLDGHGRVLFTTTGTTSRPATTAQPADGQMVISGTHLLWRPGDLHAPITAATGVRFGGHDYVVVALVSQQHMHEAVSTAAKFLLLGIPVLMLGSGLIAWWLVRRALGPVERIRAQVDRITSSRLEDRVPVPATGDEISTLAVTMNSMLARLESAQAAQRSFVADASHELRSPLATLVAALEVAGDDPTGRTWAQMSDLIGSETRRMQHLVDDLLLLSKSDDRGLRLLSVETDLDDVVGQEARRLRETTDLQVRLRLEATRVIGDPDKLTQLVRNLADNAARYAVRAVALSVAREGTVAVVLVEDDGPGIPPQDRERVLQRFVRLDTSRSRQSGGSGLGLAIAREIARAHGGSVRVGESPLGGARLEVRLPAEPLPAQERQPPEDSSR